MISFGDIIMTNNNSFMETSNKYKFNPHIHKNNPYIELGYYNLPKKAMKKTRDLIKNVIIRKWSRRDGVTFAGGCGLRNRKKNNVYATRR